MHCRTAPSYPLLDNRHGAAACGAFSHFAVLRTRTRVTYMSTMRCLCRQKPQSTQDAIWRSMLSCSIAPFTMIFCI